MQTEEQPTDSWVVCKFGGTSVALASNWARIRRIVDGTLAAGNRPLIVCSALSGVTNMLEALIEDARAHRDIAPTLHRVQTLHLQLGADLGVDAEALIAPHLAELAGCAAQIAGAGLTPRLQARLMAQGELMSTRLGAAFLAQSHDVAWQDARNLLCAVHYGEQSDRDYLSARLDTAPDRALQQHLAAAAPVVVTQGYIARAPRGDTVLLGRGGSDTSAAFLAAKLQAARVEIWTDVPGMFSANPRRVPEARMIRSMAYEEAEALALAGGKVLHPRCIDPARHAGIPIHIKCTADPDMPGTVITAADEAGRARLSAVSVHDGLLWVNARVDRRPPLDLIQRFADSFLSRDLHVNMMHVGTRNLSAAIDPLLSPVSPEELGDLLRELNGFADAEIDRDIQSLSLIGQGIDRLYHALPPFFANLEPTQVVHIGKHSDMDVTLLMPGDVAGDALVPAVHEALLAAPTADDTFGPTWQEVAQATREAVAAEVVS